MPEKKRGVLDDEKWEAVQKAQQLNPTLRLLPGNKAVKQLPDGTQLKISNNTVGVQLFWGLQGCGAGLQHYRFCTPHALSKPLSLNCFFCNFDASKCVAESRQLPAESELWLMRELMKARISTQWCWQVVPTSYWAAAADFMHLGQKAVMQADGSGHFKDMFDTSCITKLETDMSFCVKAVTAGMSVIRVHELQQRMWLHPSFLGNAAAYATLCVCVVLSPAYNSVQFYEGGRMLTYVDKLALLLKGCSIQKHDWGTVLLCQR